MLYNQARDLINDGDIIIVKSQSGALAQLTRAATRSPYTHVGQAFWMHGMLWMHEINGGHNHAIPLSQLASTDFDVYALPEGISQSAIQEAIKSMLRDRIKYGFVALLVIGLFDYFRIRKVVHWRQILVCSGYVAKTLCLAGWRECSYVISPAELAKMLTLRFSVTSN